MIEYLCAINAFLYFLKLNEIQDEIMSRDKVTVNDVSNQKPHLTSTIGNHRLNTPRKWQRNRNPGFLPLRQKIQPVIRA